MLVVYVHSLEDMIYNDTYDLCNEWTLVQLRSWAGPPHQFQYLGWELGGGHRIRLWT